MAVALLNNHTTTVHALQQTPRPMQKVDRPSLTDNINDEQCSFKKSWDMFVQANGVLAIDQHVQLFACCDSELRSKVTCTDDNILGHSTAEFLELLHNLTVILVAISVQRTELLKMQQGHGEPIRSFYSRVGGKAINCKFQVECTEPHVDTTQDRHFYVSYSNEIRHVILAGLSDTEVGRDVFRYEHLDTMSVNDLIVLIEGKEMARDATVVGQPSVNIVSQFKKSKADQTKRLAPSQTGKCNRCKTTFNLFKMRNGKYNKRPFTECQDCWRKAHPFRQVSNYDDHQADASAVSFEIAVINKEFLPPSEINKNVLPHHVFEDGDSLMKLAQPHPTVELMLCTENKDYQDFGFPSPKIKEQNILAVADSGAQCCLWGLKDFLNAGFK